MLICICFFQWVGIIQGHVHWCHPTAPYLGNSLPSRRKQPLVLVRRILRYKWFIFTLHTYFVEYLTVWWLFHSVIWLLIQQLCKCTQSSGRTGVAAHRWSPTLSSPIPCPWASCYYLTQWYLWLCPQCHPLLMSAPRAGRLVPSIPILQQSLKFLCWVFKLFLLPTLLRIAWKIANNNNKPVLTLPKKIARDFSEATFNLWINEMDLLDEPWQ